MRPIQVGDRWRYRADRALANRGSVDGEREKTSGSYRASEIPDADDVLRVGLVLINRRNGGKIVSRGRLCAAAHPSFFDCTFWCGLICDELPPSARRGICHQPSVRKCSGGLLCVLAPEYLSGLTRPASGCCRASAHRVFVYLSRSR